MINFDNCPVPILQEPWEFTQLLGIYRRLSDEVPFPLKVLEIGSFFGGTLFYWTHHAYGITTLVSVDLPIGPNDGRYEQMIESKKLWHSWMRNVVRDFHQISGDSHSAEIIASVANSFPEKDVDFLFIDGDHSYAGVKADFENYKGLVRPGGLIVFHDTIGIPDVKRFIDEIKPQYRYQEIYGGPGAWGITVLTMP